MKSLILNAALGLVGLLCTAALYGDEQQHCRDNIAGHFTYYKLAISWSPEWCLVSQKNADRQCRERRRYIVHGLWPQCERGYPVNCKLPQPKKNVLEDALDHQKIEAFMPSDKLVNHEWKKHGRCTGMARSAYFNLIEKLFNKITLPDLPPQSTAPDLIQALIAANPGLTPAQVELTCNTLPREKLSRKDTLDEVRICFDKKGHFTDCGEINQSCKGRVLVRQ